MKFRSGFVSNSSSSSFVVVGWKTKDPNGCITALAKAYLNEEAQKKVNDALEEGDPYDAAYIIGRDTDMNKFDVIHLEEEHEYLIGAVIPIPEDNLQEIDNADVEKVIGNMLQVLMWDMPKTYAGTIYS